MSLCQHLRTEPVRYGVTRCTGCALEFAAVYPRPHQAERTLRRVRQVERLQSERIERARQRAFSSASALREREA